MSSEREEIRWKYQVLIANIESVIDFVENERKIIENRVNKFVKALDNMRKHWFTGLAIIMTIMLALILEKDLDGWYYLGIVLPALTAFVIFFVTNLKINQFETSHLEIDNFYYNVRTELIPIQGLITGYALDDFMTLQKTNILIEYVRMYGFAVQFLLDKYMDEKLKKNQFEKNNYTKNYEFTKNNLDIIKKEQYPTGTKTIEQFIGLYESMK